MKGRALWLVLLCALVFSGCSSFDRDWRAAAKAPVSKADRYAGAWDGEWTSERHRLPNGKAAGGRLRCIFTRQDAGHYHARFHANWLIFATGYDADFVTRERNGRLIFEGEQDLGMIFGGIYRYEGQVKPDHFRARFASRFDHGIFDLRRPAVASVPRRLTR